ncbi:hypothetical protein BC628DRAFT_958460 [Trametes gibbosa]|nr:hypothetical protein BC628DRAFT_958460 [Trametes gibbosa]
MTTITSLHRYRFFLSRRCQVDKVHSLHTVAALEFWHFASYERRGTPIIRKTIRWYQQAFNTQWVSDDQLSNTLTGRAAAFQTDIESNMWCVSAASTRILGELYVIPRWRPPEARGAGAIIRLFRHMRWHSQHPFKTALKPKPLASSPKG